MVQSTIDLNKFEETWAFKAINNRTVFSPRNILYITYAILFILETKPVR